MDGHRYRSKHHPDNGCIYTVSRDGQTLHATHEATGTQTTYEASVWSFDDLVLIAE